MRFLFVGLVSFATILSAATACWDHCSDDFLGSTAYATPKNIKRAFLNPYEEKLIISVPKACYITQGVKAHACSKDFVPLVKVNSFSEVLVQRNGAPGAVVFVDITVYCYK